MQGKERKSLIVGHRLRRVTQGMLLHTGAKPVSVCQKVFDLDIMEICREEVMAAEAAWQATLMSGALGPAEVEDLHQKAKMAWI